MTTEDETMSEKKRLTVTLDAEEIEAVETICTDMGSPSRSAAVRRAVTELAQSDRDPARPGIQVATSGGVNESGGRDNGDGDRKAGTGAGGAG